MKLPNGENAVVPMEKLTAYCLNPNHPVGAHKARVLQAALGMTAVHAEVLRAALLHAARTSEKAEAKTLDIHGQRYTLQFWLTGPNGQTAENALGVDYPARNRLSGADHVLHRVE